MTLVFSATTRVASLTRRRRKVSNWATRQVDRLGMRLRSAHSSQKAAVCSIRRT